MRPARPAGNFACEGGLARLSPAQKRDSGVVGEGVLQGSGRIPFGIPVAAVPEPGTIGMTLAALACVSLLARRRQRKRWDRVSGSEAQALGLRFATCHPVAGILYTIIHIHQEFP